MRFCKTFFFVLFLAYPYCLSKLIELLQGMEAKFCKPRVSNKVRVSDQNKISGCWIKTWNMFRN